MARVRVALLVGVLLLSVGCVDSCAPSLHPLYTQDSLVDVPEAVGTWRNTEGAQCVVEPPLERSYQISCYEGEPGGTEASKFTARFVRMGDHLVVDLFPDADSTDEKVEQLFVVPIHLLLRVRLGDGVASLEYLSARWIEGLIAKEPDSIQHEKLDEGYASDLLLTGKSDALHSLLRRAMTEATAFSSLDVYRRVPEE